MLIGIGLLLAAGSGALWVFLIGATAAQEPDPHATESDLCCDPPESWGELLSIGAWAVVGGALVVTGVVLAVVLLRWAGGRPWPHWRAFAVAGAAGALLTALLIGASLAAQAG